MRIFLFIYFIKYKVLRYVCVTNKIKIMSKKKSKKLRYTTHSLDKFNKSRNKEKGSLTVKDFLLFSNFF